MPYRLCLLLAAALIASACASTTGSCPVLTKTAQNPEPCARLVPPPPPCQIQPPPPPGYPFRNLVLQGGGVKGIAYAGAFEQLAQQNILSDVQRVAGTSAGAITATLIALRYTPQEIQSLIFNIDFQRFQDGGATGLFRLFQRFGWYKGDYFLNLMRCLVEGKTHKPKTTFRDLQTRGFRDLHVFATNLSKGQPKEFSAELTPDFEVALAVRTSMSIPVFFASIDLKNDVFVDGGVLLNYPINTFDSRGGPNPINPATLGLTLTSPPPKPVAIDNLVAYSQQLFWTLLDAQVVDLQTNPADLQRSVLIDDLKISTTDFSLTDTQKCQLIAEGYKCTCRYLNDWISWQPLPRHSPIINLEPMGRATRIETTETCGSAWPQPQP